MKIKLSIILVLLSLNVLAQDKETWSLKECIDFAMENNLDIRETELQAKTSQVNLRETNAQRYPSLNAGGQYLNRWGRSIDPTTNQFTTERISSNGLSFRSSVPVFQGFQINNSIKQGQADLQADQYALEDMKNNVKLDIVSAYMNVIFNKALVENAESQQQTTDAQLDLTRKQVAAGALPIANEYEVASQLASDEVNLVTAKNDYQLALLTLKQLLQIPASEDFAIVEPDIEVEDYNISAYSVSEVYQTAEQTQPVVKSAEMNEESARYGIKVAKGGYYPSLNINADIFTNYSDIATDLTNPLSDYTILEQYDDNLSQSVSLNLNIPIFNNLNVRSNVQRAQIQRDRSHIVYERTLNQLRQTIELAYNDALAASETYNSAQQQVKALEETFRAIEKRYNAGAVNYVDLQLASNNLFQARTQLLQAKYDYIFRIKVLDFYLGNPITFEN
ncbi:MAG: TolC family protein [Cyclobacteriaceae bacterium]